jgi:hypothetical protein
VLALTLAQAVAAFANLATILFVVLVVLVGVASITTWPMSHERRMVRERRRHAERTVRVMGEMTAIRLRMARRMDEAERRWRP